MTEAHGHGTHTAVADAAAPAGHAGHEGHAGHGHGDHVAQFRQLFWTMLVLAIPTVALSGMFAMILGYTLPDFPGARLGVAGAGHRDVPLGRPAIPDRSHQ